jgi:hypothetical protein
MSWLINAIRNIDVEELQQVFTMTSVVDLTLRDADNKSCIDYLMYMEDDDCCTILEVMFKNGVNPDQLLWDNGTLLHYFVCIGKEKQISILLKYGVSSNFIKDYTLIRQAIYNGYHDIVQMLLDHGGDINIKDDSGYTPLHVAVEENQYICAKLLLERGADPNIPNGIGRTATMIATNHYNEPMMALLESYNFPDVKNAID